MEKPETIVPYPITFWELSQERDEEGEVVGNKIDKSIRRSGVMRARRGDLFKLVPQYQTAVVPNCIVLGVPFQQFGRQF